MAITTPKGEQIQFVSSKTGTHNLDTYLEAAEVGNRQLSDLIDDLFDATTGVFKSDNFEFRYDTSTKALQVRVGQFANSSTGWTDITSFFSVEGTFSTSTSYNNFDLVLTASKDLYLVHGLTSAQTFSSESNFTSSSNTTKIVDVSLAQDWAKKTDGIVDSSDYSSKAWAVGGTGVTNTASKGSAKEWSITTGSTVDTSEYSSKEYAVGTTVPAGSAKERASDTSGAVASSEYSAKEYAQGTQASTGGSAKSWSQDTDQVNGASTNDRSAKSWAQGANMTGSTLGGSAKDWAQLTGSTVDGTNYSAKHHATQASTSLSSASTSASNAATSATNASNSATSASSSATSASSSATTATTQAGIATTKASEASTSASNASTSETNAANTLATFQSQYHGSLSSAPTGGTVSTGDLFFNTTTSKMNVYDGSNWQTIGDIASRTPTTHTVSSAGTQTISVNYTVGLIDVYLNGLHLAPADYTASNGTSVVITGCAVGDIIEIIALSAFNAANYGTASGKNVGISNDNVPVFTTGVADNDFLKIDGTSVEGRDASQVLSDIGGLSASVASSTYAPLAGATFTGDISGTNATLSGYLRGPATFTIDPATHGDNTGTVIIAGNLQVDGTTTTINSTTVAIDDLVFSIATDASNSTAANGAGITIGGAGATLTYAHADTSWNMNKPLNVTGDVSATNFDFSGTGGKIFFGSGTDDYLHLQDVGTSGNMLTLVQDSSTKMVMKGTHGYLGIGTTSPSFPLSVQANSDAEAILVLGRSADDIGEIAFRENDNSTKLGELQYRQGYGILRHRVGYLSFETGGTTERMRIGSNGEVIIGTDVGSYTSSDFNLIVSNADSGTNILLYDDSGAYNSALITYDTNVLQLGINNSNSANSLLGDTSININASGVGVGVAPTAQLQVKGFNNSSSTPLGKIANSSLHLDHTTHLNAISQIGFGYTSSQTYSSASIGFISTDQASSGKGDLFFATRDSTSDAVPTERMKIKSNGVVQLNNGIEEQSTTGALSNSNQTLTLDLTASNNFNVTTAANITSFVVSGATSGQAYFFTLKVSYGGSHSITWPSAVKWNAGTAPTLSTSGVDIFAFYTNDGGTNIYGFTAGQALA